MLRGDVDAIFQNSEVDGITSLLAGKCDAFATDQPVALTILSQHGELMMFPEAIKPDKYGYGFAKGNPLVAPFNAAMHKLQADAIERSLPLFRWR